MAKFNNEILKTMHDMMASGISYKDVHAWYTSNHGSCSIHYMALNLRQYKKANATVVPGNVAVQSETVDTTQLDKTPA